MLIQGVSHAFKRALILIHCSEGFLKGSLLNVSRQDGASVPPARRKRTWTKLVSLGEGYCDIGEAQRDLFVNRSSPIDCGRGRGGCMRGRRQRATGATIRPAGQPWLLRPCDRPGVGQRGGEGLPACAMRGASWVVDDECEIGPGRWWTGQCERGCGCAHFGVAQVARR